MGNSLPKNLTPEQEAEYRLKSQQLQNERLKMFASAAKTAAIGIGNALKYILSKPEVKEALSKVAQGATDAATEALKAKLAAKGLSGDDVKSAITNPDSLSEDKKKSLNEAVNEAGIINPVTGGAYIEAAKHYGGCDCGHGSSTPGFPSSDLKKGGGNMGAFIGGEELDLTTIREYADSLNSFTKQALIADIVDILKEFGVKVTSSDYDKMIEEVMANIPNAKKNGKKFKEDAEKQSKLCRALAELLNRKYGKDIIDVTSPAPVICQQVAELASSLKAGMHVEFLIISAEIKKILKNLLILRGELDKMMSNTLDGIKASHDEDLKLKTAKYADLSKMINNEVDRQIEMLRGFLGATVSKTETKLEELIKRDEIDTIVQEIRIKPGSSQFGQVISDVLTGLGVTADYALLVDRALKKIGMSVDEYSKASNLRPIVDKISETLREKDMPDDELDKYLKAVDLIYKNFYRKENIKEILDKLAMKKTGGVEYTSENSYKESDLERKLRLKKEVKDVIFKTFNKQIDDYMYKVIKSLAYISDHLGDTIPISEQLDGLRSAITKLRPLLTRRNSYLVLIGYYNDALSKERRDTFINQLKAINNYIDTLLEMSIYKGNAAGHFKEIQDNILALIRLMDTYADKVAQKFGSGARHDEIGGEDDDSGCKYIESSKEGGEDDIFGGVESKPSEKFPDVPKARRVPLTLGETVRKFDYYYKVAQFKDNLKALAAKSIGKEEKHAKYVDMRSQAIAKKINDIKTLKDSLLNKISTSNDKQVSGPSFEYGWNTFDNGALPGLGEAATHVEDDASKAAAAKYGLKLRDDTIKFIEEISRVKINFWRTVEAIDEYMSLFHNNLIKHYQDILDIKSILEETEDISYWYSGKTGDYIESVFDSFPSYIQGYAHSILFYGKTARYYPSPPAAAEDRAYTVPAAANKTPASYKITNKINPGANHMYAGFNAIPALKPATGQDNGAFVAALPGCPFIVTHADDSEFGFSGVREMKKVTGSLLVLKNLLSIFIHIGYKFGGQELHKKIFMTPTQIYKNLCEYIEYCSFDMGLNKTSTFVEQIGTPFPYTFATSHNNGDNFIKVHKVNMSAMKIHTTFTGTKSGAKKDLLPDYLRSPFYYQDGDRATIHSDTAVGDLGGLLTAGQDAFVYLLGVMPHLDVEDPGNTNPTLKDATTRSTKPDYANLWYQRYGIYMRGLFNEFNTASDQELDKMFVLIIKSMCAKVLTIVGLYDILDRPENTLTFSPTRMILGAAESAIEIPPIDEGAVALYVYLPLLLEFYRELFDFQGDREVDTASVDKPAWHNFEKVEGRNRAEKISMLPELDGPFSGLIKLIFQKAKKYSVTAYSDIELRELVREINYVWAQLASKGGQDPVNYIIDELIAEINKGYGIISERDRNLYERQFGLKYDYPNHSELSEARVNEVPLLPGEEDIEYERDAPAPSRRYETGSAFDTFKEKQSAAFILSMHQTLVNRLRCLLDSYFHSNKSTMATLDTFVADYGVREPINVGDSSFKPAIKGAKNQLKAEKNNEQRFKIAASLIRGSNILSSGDNIKYLLFHETVVAGLNTLSAIHTILQRFRNTVLFTDIHLILKNIKSIINTSTLSIRDKADVETEIHKLFVNTYYKNKEGTDDDPGLISIKKDYIEDKFVLIKPTVAYDGMTDALLSVDKIGTWQHASVNQANIFAREFHIERILYRLLEAIFGVVNDTNGLVTMSFSDDKIMLNFTNIKQCVESIFSNVRYFMELLRPHIDAKLLEKYTDKLRTGSLYWLQEQLIEKLLSGRDEYKGRADTTGEPDLDRSAYVNLDGLNRIMNRTIDYITKANWMMPHSASYQNMSKLPLGQLFAEIIFYDNQYPQCGIFGSHELVWSTDCKYDSPALGVEFNKGLNKLLILNLGQKQVIYPEFSNRYHQLYSWDENIYTANRSILFSFNQLLAKYIKLCFDPTTEKIYINTISNMIYGPLNASIMNQDKTFPDIDREGTILEVLGEVKLNKTTYDFYDIYKTIDPTAVDISNTLGGTKIDSADETNIFLIWKVLVALPGNEGLDKVLDFITDPTTTAKAINALFINPPIGEWGGVNTINPIKAYVNPKNISMTYTSFHNILMNKLAPITVTKSIAGGGTNLDANEYRKFYAVILRTLIEAKTVTAPQVIVLLLDSIISTPANAEWATLAALQTKLESFKLQLVDAQNATSYNNVATIGKDIPIPKSTSKYDSKHGNRPFGRRTDPDPEHILFASLSLILKNIISSKNASNQAVIYVVDNIAEVSMFMKESFKAHMPAFRNLFKALIDKAEFIKNVMNKKDISMARMSFRTKKKKTPGIFVPWENPDIKGGDPIGKGLHTVRGLNDTPKVIDNPIVDTHNEEKNHFTAILNNIIYAASSVITCIDNVLRELGDDPKFFELHLNSITEYKTAYGKDPLMPLSSAFHILKNNDSSNIVKHLPFAPIGSANFKFAYGTRLLIGRPNVDIQPEHAPGYGQIIDLFNLTATSRDQVDKSKATELFKCIVKTLRYVNSFKHIKGNLSGLLAGSGQFWFKKIGKIAKGIIRDANEDPDVKLAKSLQSGPIMKMPFCIMKDEGKVAEFMGKDYAAKPIMSNTLQVSLFEGTVFADNANDDKDILPVKSIVENIQGVIRITESSFKEDIISELAKYISGQTNKEAKDIMVKAILDLNKVPLDVMALNDIPLNPLYNYAWNFDRLIIELFYGLNHTFAKALIDQLCKDTDGKKESSKLPITGDYIRSAKEMMIAMLVDPYVPISSTKEYEFVKDMFKGYAGSSHLGRPKFLSDELFNKSLFGELVPTVNYLNIAGTIAKNVNDPIVRDKYMRDTAHPDKPYEMGPFRAPEDPNQLTYIVNKVGNESDEEPFAGSAQSDLAIKQIALNRGAKPILQLLGRLRFSTIFVRNLIFITNAYRTLLYKLRQDLSYNRNLIARGHYAIADKNTEFKGYQLNEPSIEFDKRYGYGTAANNWTYGNTSPYPNTWEGWEK
jgi:hypothetical protein